MASKTNLRRRSSFNVIDAKVAVDLATAQTYSEVSENVFLFVPNLIGKFPYSPLAALYLTSNMTIQDTFESFSLESHSIS